MLLAPNNAVKSAINQWVGIKPMYSTVKSIRARSGCTPSAECRAAGPGCVVPGISTQKVSADWGVEAVVDPWVLVPHQHLHTHQHIRMSRMVFHRIITVTHTITHTARPLPWRWGSCWWAPGPPGSQAHQWVGGSGRWSLRCRTYEGCRWSASHWWSTGPLYSSALEQRRNERMSDWKRVICSNSSNNSITDVPMHLHFHFSLSVNVHYRIQHDRITHCVRQKRHELSPR